MIRPASPDEAKAVARFFEALGSGASQEVLGDRDLYFIEARGQTAVVLASPDLAGLPADVLEDADHLGLRIGTWEDDGFALDLQGAVLASEHVSRGKIRVTERSARLWLYGRDVLGDSIEGYDHRLSPGDACIVCNPRGEAIGIGLVTGSFKGQRSAVTPIHDLGTYLRDQH